MLLALGINDLKILIKSTRNLNITAKAVPRCKNIARLNASSGEILNKVVEKIITCPEDDMGSHSNRPCKIAIIKYSIMV